MTINQGSFPKTLVRQSWRVWKMENGVPMLIGFDLSSYQAAEKLILEDRCRHPCIQQKYEIRRVTEIEDTGKSSSMLELLKATSTDK